MTFSMLEYMNNKRYFEHSLLGDGVICEFLSTF